MIALWHLIVHWLGVDYGAPYGKWVWYNFWSGVGGSFLIGMLVYVFAWYVHHTCHHSWRCLRWGKYPAAGGLFRTCWPHHPESGGERRPHRDLIHRMHAEHKAGRP